MYAGILGIVEHFIKIQNCNKISKIESSFALI